VRTPIEFNNAIASLPAGWPVAVGLRRGGQELVVQTRLAPLALPNLPVYIPALADNHAEIRRLLADFAGRDVGCSVRLSWTLPGRRWGATRFRAA
jgi:hypothetical protein